MLLLVLLLFLIIVILIIVIYIIVISIIICIIDISIIVMCIYVILIFVIIIFVIFIFMSEPRARPPLMSPLAVAVKIGGGRVKNKISETHRDKCYLGGGPRRKYPLLLGPSGLGFRV